MADEAIAHLFAEDEYPVEFIVQYLHNAQSSQSIQQLASKLLRVPAGELITYLPQLVNLALQKPNMDALLEVFVGAASQSHSVGLRLYWFLYAHLGDELEPYRWKLESMIARVVQTMTQAAENGNTVTPVEFSMDSRVQSAFHHCKEHVFNQQLKFVQALAKVSVALIAVPPAQTVHKMKEYLTTLNTYLQLPTSQSQVFCGIPWLGTEQIVRIAVDECVCFKTKTRVPYKLVFETISINEAVCSDKHEEFTDGQTEATSPTLSVKEVLKSSDSSRPWESWSTVCERIRQNSPFGQYFSWKAQAVIVKGYDDLRQECLAMQVIRKAKQIFEASRLKLFLRPYEITVVNRNSGILECIPNCASIHAIKRSKQEFRKLSVFFETAFGRQYEEAQHKFVESMAGYSLICYLLNVKDRHNGNILIDSEGHIIHIDFGFFLTNSPGKLQFETAPFKLTREMIEVMGGYDSDLFAYYKVLMLQGFLALRQHSAEFVLMVSAMLPGETLQCFAKNAGSAVEEFRRRFRRELSDSECYAYINELVAKAAESWTTRKYDRFQKLTNSILP